MKATALQLVIFGGLAAVVLLAVMSKLRRTALGTIKTRIPLTKNEQPMYWRLIEAFPPPAYVVLAQVSFSSLLITKQHATRNTFSQKVADFVVTDRSFRVLAVIELDDGSHITKAESDRRRDAMLTKAGHHVLRYKVAPNVDSIRADLMKLQTRESAAGKG